MGLALAAWENQGKGLDELSCEIPCLLCWCGRVPLRYRVEDGPACPPDLLLAVPGAPGLGVQAMPARRGRRGRSLREAGGPSPVGGAPVHPLLDLHLPQPLPATVVVMELLLVLLVLLVVLVVLLLPVMGRPLQPPGGLVAPFLLGPLPLLLPRDGLDPHAHRVVVGVSLEMGWRAVHGYFAVGARAKTGGHHAPGERAPRNVAFRAVGSAHGSVVVVVKKIFLTFFSFIDS